MISGNGGSNNLGNESKINTEKLDRAAEKIDRAANMASDSIKKGVDIGKDTFKTLKDDYNTKELSGNMGAVSQFGFQKYLYILLIYGLFAIGNTTCMLLVAGWVALAEKDKEVLKMVLSAAVLYVLLSAGFDLGLQVFNVLRDWAGDIRVLYKILDGIRDFISYGEKFIRIGIGLFGMLRARNGKYIKINMINSLFR